jgi:putative membrane protein
MAVEENSMGGTQAMTNTDLAYERTQLAHERTLMAWVRTATSMISFGFTMYKVFQEFSKEAERPDKIFTPRIVGILMISFALLGLLLAQIQHFIAVKELRKFYPKTRRSVAFLLSALIFVFGVALLLGALYRQ